MTEKEKLIETLNLKPLPGEGGYYRETYRSKETMANHSLCTAIYYLIDSESFSTLHKVKSDEIFHFYAGDPTEMIQIEAEGKLSRVTLGPDLLNGQSPQVLVPKGTWQALRLRDGGKWALMGTTVSPGFEFEDFDLGVRAELIKQFPQHRNDIIRYTREQDA